MARILLGPLAADISGSIAGGTCQRGNASHIARSRPLPTPRTSAPAIAARQATALLATAWRSLTAAQRGLWAGQAAATLWRDRFGIPRPMRGYWLYLRCNLQLIHAGFAPLTAPAAPSALPEIKLPALLASSTSTAPAPTILGSSTAAAVSATYSVPLPPGAGGWLVLAIDSSIGSLSPSSSPFTLLDHAAYPPTPPRQIEVYTRAADGTEPAFITGTFNGGLSQRYNALCYRIGGLDPTIPFITCGQVLATSTVPIPASLIYPGQLVPVGHSILLSIAELVLTPNLIPVTLNLDPLLSSTLSAQSSRQAGLFAGVTSALSAGTSPVLTSDALSGSSVLSSALLGILCQPVLGGSVQLSWTAPSPVPSGTVLRVFASPGLSAGQGGPRDSLRFIGAWPASTASPLDITAEWSAAFGSIPPPGRAIWAELDFLDIASGTVGPRTRISTITF